MDNITVDRRLWLTADKERLVEDGDPDAAFLWAIPGREVSAADAKRVGYSPPDAPKAPAKAAPKPPNKARRRPADKSAKPTGDK